MIILLSILSVLFLGTTILGFWLAVKGGRKVQEYRMFFEDTIEDIGATHKQFNEILNQSRILSDAPEVQNLMRLIAIAHDILLGYLNVGRRKGKKDNKKKKKKKGK